jgi:hypothetical protein
MLNVFGIPAYRLKDTAARIVGEASGCKAEHSQHGGTGQFHFINVHQPC